MAVFQKCLAALVGGALALLASTPFARAQTYTLVQGLDKFEGSTTAWHLLETNGFVVADPTFKQIFEPYLDESTPVFITPDSAWHAYHALISEGIHDLEMSQKRLLLDFSRRLLASIKEQNKSPGADLSELARFVDIGLALQDETFRKSLPDDEKRIAESLLSGKREVKTGIGFPLRPKAVQTTEHEGAADSAFYVAARQYYATVDFRLSDARETRLALCLAWLIHKNGDLIQLWHQLSDPWDAILAPAEDGTVSLYWDLAANSPASDVTLAALLKNAAMLQTRLAESLPEPKSNDQQLGAGDAVDFGKLIKGFRLLPSRRLLGESWVQHMSGLSTTEKNQLSALEFFVGSPTIRSAAAVRALAALDGNATVETARKLDVGALPDSLYGRALRLLATLQEPLPEQVAPALRSQAWADKQLWSQMGAWAEAEHSEGGNRSVWVAEGANVKPSIGIVAPYPKFFEGLSKLALDAAATFEKAGIDEPFDSKTAARKLLEGILWQEGLAGGSQDETEHATGLVEQFAQFWQRTIQSHQTETENNPPAAQKLMNELETLARRCSTQTAPTDTDRDVLQHFFQDRQTVPKLLKDFAPFCDKLAGLAQKNLEGAELTDDESKWISDYGTTLAHFQCYTGSSADASRDDFPS